jgi:hypothetical protein
MWVRNCTAIEQLPELPLAVRLFSCQGCSSLQQLPDLSKCRVQKVSVVGCDALKEMRVGGCTVHLQE